ncbi:hypothetical protein [Sphingomonas sp. T9W2]|uniref:hypothetical protein n=1 Tax=Sphingomonas sp. T9W2 TaxID=3143183 RepID=UPI0031F5BF73
MIWAALYAIGAAVVVGWLLHIHATARYPIDRVPLYIFILFPLMWGPVLLVVLVIAIVVGTIWAAKLVTRRVNGDRRAVGVGRIPAMPPPRPEGVPPPARPTR